MKYLFLNRIIGIVIAALFSFSCSSSDLDFNQVNNLNIKPDFTTNLAYFDVKANQFLMNGTEINHFSYVANVDFFKSSFVGDNLTKGELLFQIKNTISRPYLYNITFYDVNDAVIDNISIDIPASNGIEIVVAETEVFENSKIDILKNTAKMVFSIIMLSGTPLTPASTGNLESSSSITAYLDIK